MRNIESSAALQNNQHSHALWIISERHEKKDCRMIWNEIGAQYSDKINYFMIYEWKWAPDCNRFLPNSLHLNCSVFVVCDRTVINHLLLLYNFTKLFYAIKWNGPLFYIFIFDHKHIYTQHVGKGKPTKKLEIFYKPPTSLW